MAFKVERRVHLSAVKDFRVIMLCVNPFSMVVYTGFSGLRFEVLESSSPGSFDF